MWPRRRRRLMRAAAERHCSRVQFGDEALDQLAETVTLLRADRPGATLGETIDVARRAVHDDALVRMESDLRACVSDEQELQAMLLRVRDRYHAAPPAERPGRSG